jgi:uncharacterized membrane protein (DUF2068 family)
MSSSPEPQKTYVESHAAGLRSVATFEAIKGILVLAAGFGLLSFLDGNLQEAGEHFVRSMHLNPAHKYPQIFLQALTEVSDKNLTVLALGAAGYAALRFIEAYGLWYQRTWAEWLAIISCSLYLPFEIYALFRGVTDFKVTITAINVLMLGYLIWVRAHEHRARKLDSRT